MVHDDILRREVVHTLRVALCFEVDYTTET